MSDEGTGNSQLATDNGQLTTGVWQLVTDICQLAADNGFALNLRGWPGLSFKKRSNGVTVFHESAPFFARTAKQVGRLWPFLPWFFRLQGAAAE
jgi:hypothetical protein